MPLFFTVHAWIPEQLLLLLGIVLGAGAMSLYLQSNGRESNKKKTNYYVIPRIINCFEEK